MRALGWTLKGLVLVSLVGATAAWVNSDKKVTVMVDGQPRSVSTQAATVGSVLARANIHIGQHDTLAPGPKMAIRDGGRITVHRGRPVTLTVDGAKRTVWVTARNVSELLDQLGMHESGLSLSANRHARLPLVGFDLTIDMPKDVTISQNGQVVQLRSTAQTVADLLDSQKVIPGPKDIVDPPVNTKLTDGMAVSVIQVFGNAQHVTIAIPAPVQRIADPTMFQGLEKVVDPGAPGVAIKVVDLITVNGKQVKRDLGDPVVTKQPKPKIIKYGTNPHQPAADGLNWTALAKCESGGNPRSVSSNGLYRGLYQFDLGTWHGTGGAGDPIDASASEQTYRAQILYGRRGTAPWPVCGKHLYD